MTDKTMGDVDKTIDRMSSPPAAPVPLPKLKEPRRVEYEGNKPIVLKKLAEAKKNMDDACGIGIGDVKVTGPKLTEEQKRTNHRQELLRHVRSAIIKRLEVDDEGHIKYQSDGQVQTSMSKSKYEMRAYAWVDAPEYHKANPDLKATAWTELGALRRLITVADGLIVDGRRPSPGGGLGIGGVAPIDVMAVRSVIKRQRFSWLRRAGWMLAGAGIVVGIVVALFLILTHTDAPARVAVRALQSSAPSPAPPPAPEQSTNNEREQPTPVAAPMHRSFAEWQALNSSASEDPHPDPPDAGRQRRRRVRQAPPAAP